MTLALLILLLVVGAGLAMWLQKRQHAKVAHDAKTNKLFKQAHHIQELADVWHQVSNDTLILGQLYQLKQEMLDHVIALDGHNPRAQVALDETAETLARMDDEAQSREATTVLPRHADISSVQGYLREIKRIMRMRNQGNALGDADYRQALDALAWCHFKVAVDTHVALATNDIADSQYISARAHLNSALATIKKSDVSDQRVEDTFKQVSELLRSIPGSPVPEDSASLGS